MSFTFGHVRQSDAVASRSLTELAEQTPLAAGIDDPAGDMFIDNTIIDVHGHAKEGSGYGYGYGYTRVRGLNALLATTTVQATPIIVAQPLRTPLMPSG